MCACVCVCGWVGGVLRLLTQGALVVAVAENDLWQTKCRVISSLLSFFFAPTSLAGNNSHEADAPGLALGVSGRRIRRKR